MQRCWEVQSPDFGAGSVRVGFANVWIFGGKSCVHLHGYLIQ